MNAIEKMIAEHDDIILFSKALRNACVGILEGKEVCVSDFRDAVDFVQNYADKHHHGKEEQFLFKEMITHLGKIGTNLVTHGMLVEHDLGRLFMAELTEALNQYENSPSSESKIDIVTNAVGYTKLIKRHIDKENAIVFTYAAKTLSAEIIDEINQKSLAFEKQAEETGVQKKYNAFLAEFVKKYA